MTGVNSKCPSVPSCRLRRGAPASAVERSRRRSKRNARKQAEQHDEEARKASSAGCHRGLVVIAALLYTQPLVADDNEPQYLEEPSAKINRGLRIAPVPLNFAGKNRRLIGLGSYLVNAQGGCNDCHTNPP